MPTATVPRSAQALVGAERPTLAQIRLLRRTAEQDLEESRKLQALHQDGLSGPKDDLKTRQAVLAYALGFFSDAEEALGEAKDPYAQALLGLINGALGDYAEAKTLLAGASKALPEAKIEFCRACLDGNLLDDADKALNGLPEGPDRDFLQGRLHEARGATEQAINAYEAALEQQPEHVEAAFKLGVLLDRIGDDDMAVEYFLVCADVWPHYLPGVINLGILYDERGESNAGVDCFRQVLAYNPRNRRAMMLLRDARASRSMYYDEREERERERMEKIMRTPVNDFELSVRSRNCLAKMNIFTLGDLLSITEQEMLSYKNFGETSLKEVKEMLAMRGLRLGMNREGDERLMSKADQKILGESVEKLELSPKATQVLEHLGVTRVGDLLQYTDLDLYKAQGSGQSVVQELSTALGAFGAGLRKPEIKV
ncbi:MAG: tetratricopeptide repeat protein [Planctomycetes bacterium]|nr:tetratricopeptide repeat protein [Planctomycetota bacterium]